ncbi:uncharacterized protein LOC131240851 isoform X2 [Magnolia sinica]|uniref:uncharacterized protein LOC131240851 isoform X2 n=1 Tax=Magnolia sinica TaxID=86752 RepID=UPI002659955D|nr:uncharacterized protein LOC131240851 isoform X2 [Magnolia sinica]
MATHASRNGIPLLFKKKCKLSSKPFITTNPSKPNDPINPMEATFCLPRHICTKLIFTTPFNRPTIHFQVDLSFHRHCSLQGRTMQSWPTQKAHRKTLVVNSLLDGGDGKGTQNTEGSDQIDNLMGISERALQSLIKASEPELEVTKNTLPELLAETQIQFPHLQEVARRLKMSQMNHEAGREIINLLQEKYSTFSKGTLEAYELGLILAELLIYQGQYENAIILLQNDYGSNLKGGTQGDPNSNEVPVERVLGPSDARPELYLAAAYMMLGKEQEARNKWKDFKEKARGIFGPPLTDKEDEIGGGEAPGVTLKFKVFKGHMLKLKRRIDAAGS